MNVISEIAVRKGAAGKIVEMTALSGPGLVSHESLPYLHE